ncbi:MAG: 30S ribosomal protein S5 [Candidatus Berkelbacteria bacterium]|nr:30S ribosomal protein S5 [Candidatus Berkelbacteria bacterium]
MEEKKIGLKSEEERDKEFDEEVIEIARVARTVRGGRRIRFRAAVVIGDRNGRVGIGVDKANEVLIAVNKAKAKARKNLITTPIIEESIPFPMEYKYRGAHVRLLPASAGTGVIAGGSVRVVVELAGIKNLLSKIMGSANKINNIRATYLALKKLSLLYNLKNISRVEKEKTPKIKKLKSKNELPPPEAGVSSA